MHSKAAATAAALQRSDHPGWTVPGGPRGTQVNRASSRRTSRCVPKRQHSNDTRVANPYLFKRLADGVLPERHSACIPKRRYRTIHPPKTIVENVRSAIPPEPLTRGLAFPRNHAPAAATPRRACEPIRHPAGGCAFARPPPKRFPNP